jgi:hypothetical protein
MNRTKLLTILMALILALGMATVPALAAAPAGDIVAVPEYDELSTTEDELLTTDNSKGLIPVYGYVGEDAIIDDDEKDDPTKEPDVYPFLIDVSVPVKVIWAAFESGGGAVTSPDYYIENHGDDDLTVTLVSFAANGADNTNVDSDLSLTLAEVSAGAMTNSETSTTLVSSGNYPANNDALGTLATGKWNFKLTGTYDGSFTTPYEPSYLMVLKFEV